MKNPDKKENWRALISFAQNCLSNPNRGGRKKNSLATVVNKKIVDFEKVGEGLCPSQTLSKLNKDKKILIPNFLSNSTYLFLKDEGFKNITKLEFEKEYLRASL